MYVEKKLFIMTLRSLVIASLLEKVDTQILKRKQKRGWILNEINYKVVPAIGIRTTALYNRESKKDRTSK